MRIIKLSEEIFDNLKSVIHFFEDQLTKRNPVGKFRFTKGRISKDGLQLNEKLLFSYKGTIYYKAISKSGRCNNSDQYSTDYPYYFQIDLNSLSSVQASLHDFEKEYHKITNETKSIVQSQGWPIISNDKYVNILWDFIT